MYATRKHGSGQSPKPGEVLGWEAVCISAEMLGIAGGLYLLLGLQWTAAGIVALCGTAGMSCLIRAQHYLGNGSSQPAAR